jgi:hypothetical protein
MFRATFSPILKTNLTVYTALVQRTDLLLTGDTVEMELQLFEYLVKVCFYGYLFIPYF